MIRKIDRNSIAYHFISIIHIIVYELEIIRETLNTSDLSDSHSSI